MPKGQQRSNKEARKPKKESSSGAPKPLAPPGPSFAITTVIVASLGKGAASSPSRTRPVTLSR